MSRGFPSQWDSNVGSVSMSWRHQIVASTWWWQPVVMTRDRWNGARYNVKPYVLPRPHCVHSLQVVSGSIVMSCTTKLWSNVLQGVVYGTRGNHSGMLTTTSFSGMVRDLKYTMSPTHPDHRLLIWTWLHYSKYFVVDISITFSWFSNVITVISDILIRNVCTWSIPQTQTCSYR